MSKSARWVAFVFNITGIWSALTPPILAGVATVLGLLTHAPVIFYITVVAIVVVIAVIKLGSDYFKWKRWDKL